MDPKWIVMKHYTFPTDVEGKERVRHEPRFFCDTEAEATVLSQRLNRAGTVWNSLVTLAPERRGIDHAQQLANAETVLKAMDPESTSDSRYVVEPAHVYSGPSDDVTPVFVAMMTAFAALPNPPANPFEALYRLIRDASA